MHLLKKILQFSALVLVAGTALATPKPNVVDGGNRWLITAYNDASAGHTQMATQGICFLPYAQVGTHIRGRWYSDTFPDWNGIYSQEGDQVILHGDYANDVGHDGIQFDISTNNRGNRGMGHWTEWRENGSYGNTVVFANTELQRVGSCDHTVSFESLYVPHRYLKSGKIAQDPLQPDQVESHLIKELRK